MTTSAPLATVPDSAAPAAPRPRPVWRAVTIPTEHGGWGLTLEPVLLGLIIQPSWAGLCLSVAAFVAFLVRTPLKIALGDMRARRRYPRTTVALRVAAIESAVGLAFFAGAVAATRHAFWWPILAAMPLVAVQLWFDIRHRSRRLAPEVTGSVAVSAAVAAIVLAGGGDTTVAIAMWMVLAARAVTSVPWVVRLVQRLHHRPEQPRITTFCDIAAALLAAIAVAVESRAALGTAAVLVVIGLQRLGASAATLPPAKVLGFRQMGFGLGVVALSAVGVLWP